MKGIMEWYIHQFKITISRFISVFLVSKHATVRYKIWYISIHLCCCNVSVISLIQFPLSKLLHVLSMFYHFPCPYLTNTRNHFHRRSIVAFFECSVFLRTLPYFFKLSHVLLDCSIWSNYFTSLLNLLSFFYCWTFSKLFHCFASFFKFFLILVPSFINLCTM